MMSSKNGMTAPVREINAPCPGPYINSEDINPAANPAKISLFGICHVLKSYITARTSIKIKIKWCILRNLLTAPTAYP